MQEASRRSAAESAARELAEAHAAAHAAAEAAEARFARDAARALASAEERLAAMLLEQEQLLALQREQFFAGFSRIDQGFVKPR